MKTQSGLEYIELEAGTGAETKAGKTVRDRASALGGKLTIESLASQGTEVRVSIPKLGTLDNE